MNSFDIRDPRVYKRMMVGRRIALALALLGSLVALAGCGFSKAVDPVASAATKTEDAGGAKMAMTFDIVAPGGKSFTFSANGVFDKDQGDMTMDLSSVLEAAGAPAGLGGQMEIRFLTENGDPVVYVNFPALAAMLPGGEAWIKINLEQAGKSLGVDLNQLMSQANQNPAQMLDMLRASGSVEKVGEETVNGESTTHYTASIDLAKAAEQLGSAGQAMVDDLIAKSGVKQVPVDVWIGDDGLVRRMTMDLSMAQSGQTAAAHVTIDISDYGTPVNVEAPPADQTTDLSALVGALSPTH
jgi:hypothetical protein